MKTLITIQEGTKKHIREIGAVAGIVAIVFSVLVFTEGAFNRNTVGSAEATSGGSGGQYTLSVSVSPADGGLVVTSGGGGSIECGEGKNACSASYGEGDVASLSVAHETQTFQGWSGCDEIPNFYTCNVTMNGNKTIHANFGGGSTGGGNTGSTGGGSSNNGGSDPTPPSCPFSSADGVVVNLSQGARIPLVTNSYAYLPNTVTRIDRSVSLDAGTYTVKTFSWDGYADRVNVSQSNEQWNLELSNNGSYQGGVGPTSDLGDNVISATRENTFSLTINGSATRASAVHAYPNDTSSPQSVLPLCAVFQKQGGGGTTPPPTPSPAPTCSLSANPSTVSAGASAVLTLSSTNAVLGTISKGTLIPTIILGGNGTTNVTPAQTTTYTATVTGSGGTATCSATVTVGQTPPPTTPTCTLSANPNTITQGGSATLTLASQNATSATINQGVGSIAVNGTKNVTPNQTTTYTATVTGAGGSATCTTMVTVNAVVPNPTCSLTINPSTIDQGDGTTLTWTSTNATGGTINQNIGAVGVSGSRTINPTQTTTYTGTFTGSNGQTVTCSASVTVVVKPEPDVPACPFTPNDGTIVTFTTTRTPITSVGYTSGIRYLDAYATLPAGTYTVKTFSWDGYNGREDMTQTREQWNVETYANGSFLDSAGPTTDIADRVRSASAIDTFVDGIVIAQTANKVRAQHAFVNDTSSAQSVVPVCAAFKKKEIIPTPTCTLSANPNTITQGGSATLTLASQNATSATINQGVGSIAVNGTKNVTPNQTTTYTATVTGQGGTATCQTTVNVNIPMPDPTCNMYVSPTSITTGNTAMLYWNSTNVANASINSNVGTVNPNGQTQISPTQTTTYTGTFIGTNGQTITCQATLTVTPLSVPSCTLNANPNAIIAGAKSTLTFTAVNGISATINNGVGSVSVPQGTKEVYPTQTTTYTATVTGTNNQTATCSATVTVTPQDQSVPVCPFTPSADLTVIDFNGGKARANADVILSSTDSAQNSIGPKNVTLVPGIYTVQTYSWDGYNGRASISQPHEQWNTVVKNAAGTTLGTAGATTDIQDNVTEAAVSNTFTDVFTLTQNAASVYAVHAYPNNISEVNSVVPVCVAFQKKIQNPAKIHGCVYEDVNRSNSKDAGDLPIPNTLITLTGTTYLNESVTRTVNTGTNGCYLFDNLVPGTYRVAETQPAGYDDFSDQIGTKGGTTANDVFSNIVLASGDFSENNNFGEVKPPVTPPAPICTLTANPILINQGGFSTLTLTSQNATSASISPAVGTITGTSGSYTVSPTQTTTYTATVTGANNQTATCVATVTVTTPSALACSMIISSSKVKLGDKITLTWSAQNATNATIDPGVGTVSTSGSREITIFGDTTYTGTFTGANNQTTTCTARVEVEKGGGSCTNCGGGGGSSKKVTKPNVVLSSRSLEPLDNFVYLSSMPYTGFEAGPFTTALFWIVIFGLSTGVAYAFTFLAPLSFLDKAFAKVKRTRGIKDVIREREIIKAGIVDIAPHLFPASYTVATKSPAAIATETASANVLISASAGSVQDDASLIEESAHTHGILLSPEAERIIKAEMHRAGGNAEIVLDDIFGRATREYQKEDGWILLSKERINTLIEKNEQKEAPVPASAPLRVPSQGAIHARELADVIAQVSVGNTERTFEARVPTAPALVQKQAEAPREVKTLQEGLASFAAYRTEKKDITPARFIELVIVGKQAEVFEMLRTLSGEGKAEAFILDIVRALDDVYKNRIEGGRTPNGALVTATALWSNRDFEEVIRTFVECVDYSYTSPLVGTKVALAKLFEKFGTK